MTSFALGNEYPAFKVVQLIRNQQCLADSRNYLTWTLETVLNIVLYSMSSKVKLQRQVLTTTTKIVYSFFKSPDIEHRNYHTTEEHSLALKSLKDKIYRMEEGRKEHAD